MAPKHWPPGFVPLLCLGVAIALHLPTGAAPRTPTAWRFAASLASTARLGMERNRLFVPSGIELLGGWRGCPSQLLFHFNAHNLERGYFLQRADRGLLSTRISWPLAFALTEAQRHDCKARGRMHPLPGFEKS